MWQVGGSKFHPLLLSTDNLLSMSDFWGAPSSTILDKCTPPLLLCAVCVCGFQFVSSLPYSCLDMSLSVSSLEAASKYCTLPRSGDFALTSGPRRRPVSTTGRLPSFTKISYNVSRKKYVPYFSDMYALLNVIFYRNIIVIG